MIHKQPSPLTNHTRVLFELAAALWADRIFVVGECGEGPPSRTPLTQERDGVWRTTLDLPAGQPDRCRYGVDGEWRADFYADSFATAEGIPTRIVNLP